jgi:hypothetical protein
LTEPHGFPCGLGDTTNDGLSDGFDDGFDEGLSDGPNDGLGDRFDDGFGDGTNDGLTTERSNPRMPFLFGAAAGSPSGVSLLGERWSAIGCRPFCQDPQLNSRNQTYQRLPSMPPMTRK